MASQFSEWFALGEKESLDLRRTLLTGQVFCWRVLGDGVTWVGVIGQTAYMLRASPSISFSYALREGHSVDDRRSELRDFFQLDVSMASLSREWARMDASGVMGRAIQEGLRVCQQDPLECIVSFIVSANNNIKRISQILWRLRSLAGVRLGEIQDGEECVALHAFPTVSALAALSEETLREIGLGYRAPYIQKTAARIVALGGEACWAAHHHSAGAGEVDARAFLEGFHGVGRKVADCVLLYAFGFAHIVPVDTHMLAIAQRHYRVKAPKGAGMHEAVQSALVAVFGPRAGWAHCHLFAADLPPSPAKRKEVPTEESPSSNKTRRGA